MFYKGCSLQILGVGAIFFIGLQSAHSAIFFPEELTTLASLAYSLLPPIKLGQDSRFGLGFRLGRNADAQVLLEFGPQKNTASLGGSSSKRQNDDPQASSDRQRRVQMWQNILKRMEKAAPTENIPVEKS